MSPEPARVPGILITPELTTVLDAVDGVAVLYDRQGRIQYVNRRGRELMRISVEDVRGLTPLDFRGSISDAEARHRENLDLMATGRELLGSHDLFHADDREMWLRIDKFPVRSQSGEVTGLLVLSYDVTSFQVGQRQSNEARLAAEARYKALLEACPDMIFRIRRDGALLDYWAPTADNGGKDEMGVRPTTAGVMPENMASLIAAGMVEARRSQDAATEFEFQIDSVEGPRYFHARVIASAHDEWISYVRNITAQKHIERSRALQARLAEFRAAVHQASDTSSCEEGMLRQVARVSMELLDSPAVRIWLLDTASNALVLTAAAGAERFTPTMRITLGTGWVGRVVLEPGRQFVTETIPEAIQAWAHENGVRCLCAFPLRLESRLLGAFGICFREHPPTAVLAALEQSAGILAQIMVRRRTERELNETVARLSAIIENEPECVMVTNLDGCILEMNRAGLRMVCASSLDVLRGAGFLLLVHEEERRRFADHHHRVALGASDAIEFRIRALDATVHVLAAISTAIRNADGNITAIVSLLRDITEQKAMEQERAALAEALRVSEERYRLALEGSGAGLWDWPDCGRDELYLSPHFLGLVGMEAAESPRTVSRADLVSLLDSDCSPATLSAVEHHLQQPSPLDVEVRLRCYGDTYRWFRFRGQAVYDDNGRPLRMAGSIQDIHERKSAEQEVHRLNQELEQRVRQRTEQLLMSYRELESFSYTVSHDLRAPLRAIAGFSRALQEDYARQLDPAGVDFLNRIRTATGRMDTLIDNLLSLAHYTRVQPRIASVNLSTIVCSLAAELSTVAQRDVRFVVQPDIIAPCDEDLLRIVLSNLIENAWKFTSRKDTAQIEFGETRQQGSRVFFTRDDGAGFNMDYAEKLFQPFQRLHTQSEFPGSGIGLALAHRIVTRHGGSIWAEGAAGRGATFYFTLS